MPLNIISNAVKIPFNNVVYDFLPIKTKRESDIAFDVKARLVDLKTNKHIKEIKINSNEVAKVPLGFSLNMPSEFKVLTSHVLSSLENYIDKMSDYKMNIIKGMANYNKPQLSDFISDEDELLYYPSSQLLGRSGMFFKSYLDAFIGQIDNEYDDELTIALTNIGDEVQTIKFGERIGQLEIKLVPQVIIQPNYVSDVRLLNGGSRGGFGSSGR